MCSRRILLGSHRPARENSSFPVMFRRGFVAVRRRCEGRKRDFMAEKRQAPGSVAPLGPEALSPVVHIVDDDPGIRRLLRGIVEAGGWTTELYETAEGFMGAFRPERPGCVLLDMQMPGMSGLDLLRKLKDRNSILSVIMVTGHGDVSLAVQAMKDGALDFIEKPVAAIRILETVPLAVNWSMAELGKRQVHAERERRFARLTERERQVLDRVVMGEINKKVA
ncbi:MAG: response regulator transcription factor, partial [Alphaproteobacteria bacterium]|nr:response regulator transcription factor [Alphaproteobacteria bacterium]